MADRYWVGGTASWDATAGSKWATTSGGAGGAAVPTASDDVFFDAASGAVTVTLNGTQVARSLDFNGFTGTFSYTANSSSHSITLGTSTVPASNIALRLVAGMTYNGGSANRWTFASTNGTAQTITTAGKSMPNSTFSGTGGSWQWQDNWTFIGATVVISAGTVDTNSVSWTSASGVISVSGTATLTCGTSTFTFTDTGISTHLSVGTSAVVNGSSATWIVAGASANKKTFSLGTGNSNFGTLQYTVADSPGILAISGTATWSTIEVSPEKRLELQANRTQTVTNLLTTGRFNGYQRMYGSIFVGTVSVPDSAALSALTDFDIRVRVSLDDWTPSSAMTLLAKRGSINAQIEYMFSVLAAGTLELRIADGASLTTTTSSTAPTVTNGVAYWMRVTRRASDGRVQFFQAPDSVSMPSSWTQVGTDQTNTRTMQDTTNVVCFGGHNTSSTSNTSNPILGNYYRAQLRNNVLDDGTGIQLDADFTKLSDFGKNTFTEDSANAATVTKQDISQMGDGRIHIASGTGGSAATISKSSGIVAADFLRVSDSTATGGATFYAGSRSADGGGNTGWLFVDPYHFGDIKLPSTTTGTGSMAAAGNGAIAASSTTVGAGAIDSLGQGSAAALTTITGTGEAAVPNSGGGQTALSAVATGTGEAHRVESGQGTIGVPVAFSGRGHGGETRARGRGGSSTGGEDGRGFAESKPTGSMRAKQVVIRQEWGVKAAVPVAESTTGNYEAHGLFVYGGLVEEGDTYVTFYTLGESYGTKLNYTYGTEAVTPTNNPCFVTGSFYVRWPLDEDSYPLTAQVRVVCNGEQWAAETFRATDPPGSLHYLTSGAFGPMYLDGPLQMVVQGSAVDFVAMGVIWCDDDDDGSGSGGGGDPGDDDAPPGALSITSTPSIPTLILGDDL